MSVIHTDSERRLDARLLLFPCLLGLAFTIFFFRLWYFQVVRADDLAASARAFGTTKLKKLAPRGIITDRNGLVLADVRPQVVVTVRPKDALEQPAAMKRLSAALGVPSQKLLTKVREAAWRPYIPTTVAVGVPLETASRIAEWQSSLPGISVEAQPMRGYPDPVSFSHLLGYVWTPSAGEVARLQALGVEPGEYVGKMGLEYLYERQLMGKPGTETIEVDAKRRPLRTIETHKAVPGDKLVLSIDAGLQRTAQALLAGVRGAIVAIQPSTGEVLALASSPSFDSSLFLNGISRTDWEAIRADPARPLLNRAIYSAYSPGSTFKIVTSIAAYLAGKFDPNRRGLCVGSYTIGDRKFKCLGVHGAIDFDEAFVKSCNAYFAELAVRAGVSRLREASKAVGFGARTGIDILGESKGIVPTREWIARWRNPPTWYTGDTVNFGVGQGELACTPLQMASLAAFVGNRGTAYRPHLVRGSVSPDGVYRPMPRDVLARMELPNSFWNTLEQAMIRVIESGTGQKAVIPGLVWGGKTGSTENRRDKKTHSWFVGIAPIRTPKLAVAVVVENAGHGGEVAAPIARKLVAAYLKLESSEPTQSTASEASSEFTSSTPGR